MELVYLDSNVFISIIKEEIGFGFRMLFTESKEFLDYCRNNGLIIVLPDLFFDEAMLVTKLSKQDIMDFFEAINGLKLKLVAATEKDKKIARNLNTHYTDALHASIALNNSCDCIVSWNKKDFEQVKCIQALTPKEFLQANGIF